MAYTLDVFTVQEDQYGNKLSTSQGEYVVKSESKLKVSSKFIEESAILKDATELSPGNDLLIYYNDPVIIQFINDYIDMLLQPDFPFANINDAVRLLKASEYLQTDNVTNNIVEFVAKQLEHKNSYVRYKYDILELFNELSPGLMMLIGEKLIRVNNLPIGDGMTIMAYDDNFSNYVIREDLNRSSSLLLYNNDGVSRVINWNIRQRQHCYLNKAFYHRGVLILYVHNEHNYNIRNYRFYNTLTGIYTDAPDRVIKQFSVNGEEFLIGSDIYGYPDSQLKYTINYSGVTSDDFRYSIALRGDEIIIEHFNDNNVNIKLDHIYDNDIRVFYKYSGNNKYAAINVIKPDKTTTVFILYLEQKQLIHTYNYNYQTIIIPVDHYNNDRLLITHIPGRHSIPDKYKLEQIYRNDILLHTFNNNEYLYDIKAVGNKLIITVSHLGGGALDTYKLTIDSYDDVIEYINTW